MLHRYRNVHMQPGMPMRPPFQHPNSQIPYPYGMYPPQYPNMQGMPQMPYMNGMQYPYTYMDQGVFHQGSEKQANHLFQNPLQPEDGYFYEKYNNQQSFPNAYPKPPQLPKVPNGNSVLNSFKTQTGSLDLNKMVNTAGQVVNAINQVSNMAKGLGGIFKV
ncbi:YppG family protein [Lederbergia panacisoli]|uniref:YppG family protein n=1 Tax=Lederbergia panacisoli TaxID=1255251 RepID=UPI00214CC448|nr:YppG family protein [Lederbergia panacisoli]MCR2820203.1 YppG family protein [Lederbergia panacisoli]